MDENDPDLQKGPINEKMSEERLVTEEESPNPENDRSSSEKECVAPMAVDEESPGKHGIDENQPAPITTAITIIISHFVVSPDGITQTRLELLQNLLHELSQCDEETKAAVEALNQILAALQPQDNAKSGESSPPSLVIPEVLTSEPELIVAEIVPPDVVASESSDITKQKLIVENGGSARKGSADFMDHSKAKILETYNVEFPHDTTVEPMEVGILAESNSNYTSPNVKAMEEILKSQRTQQPSSPSKPSIYDLCLWCNKLVLSSKTKDHAMQNHRSIIFLDKFKCPFCAKTFNSNSTVLEHMRYIPLCSKSETDCPITCCLCKDTFVGAGTVREHYYMFHNIGDSNEVSNETKRIFWSCIYCGIAEHSKVGLSKHIKTYHHNNVSPQFCRFCGTKYFTLKGLHKHLIIRHRLGLDSTLHDYYTLVCDYKFHIESKETSKICCKYCDEEINNDKEAERHIIEDHYLSDEDIFLCAFCNSTFKDRESLEKHVINGHMLGGLGYTDGCTNATTHKRTTHSVRRLVAGDTSMTGQKEIQSTTSQNEATYILCPICTQTIDSNDHDHFKEHPAEELVKAAADRILLHQVDWMISEQCSDVRIMISTLARHIEYTSEIMCTLCLRVFKSNSIFNFHFQEKHAKKHLKQCRACHLLFKCHSSLDKHVANVHKVNPRKRGRHAQRRKPSRPRGRPPKPIAPLHHTVANGDSTPLVPIVIPSDDMIPVVPIEVPTSSNVTTELSGPSVVDAGKGQKGSSGTRPAVKLSCTLCDYQCSRIDHLEEHVQGKHFKATINHCTMCNSKYSRRRDLRRHYITRHHMDPVAARKITELALQDEFPQSPFDRASRGESVVGQGPNILESSSISAVFADTGEVMNVTEGKDEGSNDNLCDINPDILDISLVGNLDKD